MMMGMGKGTIVMRMVMVMRITKANTKTKPTKSHKWIKGSSELFANKF